MIDWAQQIVEQEGDRFLDMPREEAVRAMRDLGLPDGLEGIREDCARMNIHYDNWFSEQSLYDRPIPTGRSLFDQVMSILRQGDHLYMADGAVWFDAKALGGDKDEVIIRSNGEPGYFVSDIAYHYNKFVQRGFEWVIDVWGADHQGHVPRMKAMMEALGLDPERLTLYIYQMVTLLESGEQVRLSKRAGTSVDLRELLDDIGPDAVRFFLLSRAADSQMDLDLDLARQQSDENPVYYVQYGHARIASILRYAEEQGHTDAGSRRLAADPSVRAGPDPQDAGTARSGGPGRREPGPAPPDLLCPGPGRRVPRLLPRLPRRQLRAGRRRADQGPAAAGQGGQAGAGPDAGADGGRARRRDVMIRAAVKSIGSRPSSAAVLGKGVSAERIQGIGRRVLRLWLVPDARGQDLVQAIDRLLARPGAAA